MEIKLENAEKFERNRIVDILNELFGCDYDGFQHACWTLDDANVVWFPQVTLDADAEPRSGWRNVLCDGGNRIETEFVGDGDAVEKERNAARYADKRHVTFAKLEGEGGYRFCGVYECRQNGLHRTFTRVATEFEISDKK